MNQGRIWCVVNPTVGLPLFLGSVAATSLIVHACVLTHTNWMENYWAGNHHAVATSQAAPASSNVAYSVTVSPATVAGAASQAAFVITFTPNGVVANKPAAHAVPLRTASAS